jgi:hypothetical protein
VKLPEEKRKDLQTLERPEGIVLTCQGQPMNPAKAEASAANANSATGGGGPAPSEAQRQYRININAPRNLWVQGADVNTEIGLSENFRVEYSDAASIYGEVHVQRGEVEVEVLGRRFNIQNSSQVRFTGPAAAPYINATAEYNNESAGVKVYVAVRGQGKDFTIKPTSDPPLPETDIYTLLATGRRTLKAGSGASSMNQGQVASVLGSVLASQAKKALAAKLPLDVLTIESGDEGLAGARLEVGKYLTDKLYLGYSGAWARRRTSPPRGARTPTPCGSSTSSARAGAWRPSTATRRWVARTSSGAGSTEAPAQLGSPAPAGSGRPFWKLTGGRSAESLGSGLPKIPVGKMDEVVGVVGNQHGPMPECRREDSQIEAERGEGVKGLVQRSYCAGGSWEWAASARRGASRPSTMKWFRSTPRECSPRGLSKWPRRGPAPRAGPRGRDVLSHREALGDSAPGRLAAPGHR